MNAPIVLGAGPAGSTAAILLARAGAEPVLIDRDTKVGDAICGGFLSWQTVASLNALGCDPGALGAHPVGKLRLFAGKRSAETSLPRGSFGLSRKALDTALRGLALGSGARLEIDRAREVRPGLIIGERQSWPSGAIFLATGKHDIRGEVRPRTSRDPALGLRVRSSSDEKLRGLIGDAIELHLFSGGYAGIVLQEDGTANICLALRKSLLSDAGGDPRVLFDRLANAHPHFGARMAFVAEDAPIDTIGSVPYGWKARDTTLGMWRLGDQIAVIPSLAGEGMGIAIASARAAVEDFTSTRSAHAYQHRFASAARRPVAVAGLLWHLAESPIGAAWMTRLAGTMPGLAQLSMRLSRI